MNRHIYIFPFLLWMVTAGNVIAATSATINFVNQTGFTRYVIIGSKVIGDKSEKITYYTSSPVFPHKAHAITFGRSQYFKIATTIPNGDLQKSGGATTPVNSYLESFPPSGGFVVNIYK